MPELPEVETIKIGLQKYIVGKKIESVEVRLSKQLQGNPQDISGTTITEVKRFGKGLVIILSNGYCLAIHVKMTGQLVYRDATVTNEGKFVKVPNSYTHVIFHLDHDARVYYNDFRQFGWIRIVKSEKLKDERFFRDLGPEPSVTGAMDGQVSLTKGIFAKILSKVRIPVKVVLMDQKKIAGIGNIYANDALFLAKIDPRRKANTLSPAEQNTLFNAISTVLKKGIAEGGSSENSYVNALGEQGNYQKYSLVYRKEGKSCLYCGTKIEKIMLAGRGTFFCPSCQKLSLE